MAKPESNKTYFHKRSFDYFFPLWIEWLFQADRGIRMNKFQFLDMSKGPNKHISPVPDSSVLAY